MDGTNNLPVQIQSITGTADGSFRELLPNPIVALLDSSLPYLWLPLEAALLFEDAFSLEWNETVQLYLVNDTMHENLVRQNASIIFNLGGIGSSTSVNITLPYASFDLNASAPLVTPASRYFPLKRAADSTQFVLGRTFFQEAFVLADFERRNFSVFPCHWGEDTLSPEIITIDSPSKLTPDSILSIRHLRSCTKSK